MSGVRPITAFDTGALSIHIGGDVRDFDAKQYVRPRKSLKVMSREIQFAFTAADLAMADARLGPQGNAAAACDPDRLAVVFGSDMIYCELDEVVEAGGCWAGLATLKRKSGAVFQAVQTVTVVADPLGEPLGLVSLIEDDTPNRRRRDRLNGLMRLGAALNAERDPAAVLARVCRDARELFAADGAMLSRLDARTGELVFVAVDAGGRSTAVPAWIPATELDQRLLADALERVTVRRNIESAMAGQTYSDAGTAPEVTLRTR